jgi:hypothetical protein
MSIYPDPNAGEFSLKYKITQPAVLTIYDLKGVTVYSQTLNVAEQKISVNNLKVSPGIYHSVISANGNIIADQKFIVVK